MPAVDGTPAPAATPAPTPTPAPSAVARYARRALDFACGCSNIALKGAVGGIFACIIGAVEARGAAAIALNRATVLQRIVAAQAITAALMAARTSNTTYVGATLAAWTLTCIEVGCVDWCTAHNADSLLESRLSCVVKVAAAVCAAVIFLAQPTVPNLLAASTVIFLPDYVIGFFAACGVVNTARLARSKGARLVAVGPLRQAAVLGACCWGVLGGGSWWAWAGDVFFQAAATFVVATCAVGSLHGVGQPLPRSKHSSQVAYVTLHLVTIAYSALTLFSNWRHTLAKAFMHFEAWMRVENADIYDGNDCDCLRCWWNFNACGRCCPVLIVGLALLPIPTAYYG